VEVGHSSIACLRWDVPVIINLTTTDEESARIGNCLSKEKADECAALGGACVIERDGFYPVATFCFLAGVSLYFFLQWRFVPLQKLSRSAWKVRPANSH